jgi:hypothetical protein
VVERFPETVDMRLVYARPGQEDSGSLDFGESFQIRTKDAAHEQQVRELTLTGDSYQAGRLQVIEMVRQGRGAHPMSHRVVK